MCVCVCVCMCAWCVLVRVCGYYMAMLCVCVCVHVCMVCACACAYCQIVPCHSICNCLSDQVKLVVMWAVQGLAWSHLPTYCMLALQGISGSINHKFHTYICVSLVLCVCLPAYIMCVRLGGYYDCVAL